MKLTGVKTAFTIIFLFMIVGPITMVANTGNSAGPAQDTLYFWEGNNLGSVYLVTKDKNVDPAEVYSIENGVLNYSSKEQAYLRTKEEFENYKIHVEWRWETADEKGNSGVLIHIAKPDSVWPNCLQINLKKDNAGDLLGMSGAQCDQTKDKPKETSVKFSPSNEKSGIGWNSCDITCTGDSVTVYVNGLLQNTGSHINSKKGGVGLQLEGRPVMFRNVYLIKQ